MRSQRATTVPGPYAARPAMPGELLLHPLVIGSVVVLLLNDHWWKQAYASWWTGKISDVAGLLFFPLVLVGLWQLGCVLTRRDVGAHRLVLVAAVALTAAFFTWFQISEAGSLFYEYGLGALQWPAQAAKAWITGAHVAGVRPVAHTADPSDLLALPALMAPVFIGWHRARS